MSAPAAKYASWISAMSSGRVRLSRSGSPLTSRPCSRKSSPRYSASDNPRRWMSTPHEPSSTPIRRSRISRSWSVAVTVSLLGRLPPREPERCPRRGLFRRLVTRSPSCLSKLSGTLTIAAGRRLVEQSVVRASAEERRAQPVVRPETLSWFSACRIRCSSCQRSAAESPASTFSSSAFAASSCACARESSISLTFTASSTSASARSSSTLKKPGPVANSRISLPPRCTRVEPAFNVATSGACRASTPISPAAPGTISMWASPEKTGPSGVTTETSNGGWSAISAIGAGLRGDLLEIARALDRVLDRALHVEGRLGELVVLALDDRVEARDRVLELDVLAGRPGELLGDEVRLREEQLHLPGARDDALVLVTVLVHAEDRYDVLQVLVALQDLLDARRDAVVVVRDDAGLERPRRRVERVHRRVDPLLHDRARQGRRRVEVGERVCGRGVRQVVRRHVDRLHRRHRAGRRRGDPLLELPHLGGERGLVADGARHAAEERRDLGAGLDEPEDVVDEQQHVLALVAEVLRHRQPGQADPQASARRLVHLPVDEGDLVDHARLGHLEQQVGRLAPAVADAREHRDAAVLLREVVDQLLDQDGLADAGPAEQAELAALDVGRNQVDALQAGLEDLDLRREIAERRRIAVNRPALDVGRRRGLARGRLARHGPTTGERTV